MFAVDPPAVLRNHWYAGFVPVPSPVTLPVKVTVCGGRVDGLEKEAPKEKSTESDGKSVITAERSSHSVGCCPEQLAGAGSTVLATSVTVNCWRFSALESE